MLAGESQTKDLESLWDRPEGVYNQVGSQTEAVKLALKGKLGEGDQYSEAGTARPQEPRLRARRSPHDWGGGRCNP